MTVRHMMSAASVTAAMVLAPLAAAAGEARVVVIGETAGFHRLDLRILTRTAPSPRRVTLEEAKRDFCGEDRITYQGDDERVTCEWY